MVQSRFASSKMIESKRQVKLADPTAGCAVGRDAAGASSRQRTVGATCGGRRSYDAAVWTTFGRVEWRQIESPYRKRLLA